MGYSSDPELRTVKREFKFGAGNAVSHSEKRQRAQSAKGDRHTFDEKNIRNTKLTTQDYINNDRSMSKKKKGKYGVTVPKPFDFDVRDKFKKKGIRE